MVMPHRIWCSGLGHSYGDAHHHGGVQVLVIAMVMPHRHGGVQVLVIAMVMPHHHGGVQVLVILW